MGWPKGKPKSPEQRAKLSAAMKDRTLSPEHRAKIAAATKRRWEGGDPSLVAAREAATAAVTRPLGSRQPHPDGYVLVKTTRGWELEHRVVMAAHLGRELRDNEDVHHENEDKTDNRLDNLKLMTKRSHGAEHAAERERSERGCFLPKG